MTPRHRPPRAEEDPLFRARRREADRAAEAVRRQSLVAALLWFCGFQLLGAAIGFSSFHARDEAVGWAILYLGYFVGNAGSFLAVWWCYLRREKRGEW